MKIGMYLFPIPNHIIITNFTPIHNATTASNTQDKNSAVPLPNPLSNPQENQHKHHHNPLLEHRPNPHNNLSQTTRQHNTQTTRKTPSEGTFQFPGSNVLAHGKTKATIPQETLSGIFIGIFPVTITDILMDTITHIFPNKTTDECPDMERPPQLSTGCQNTEPVFATHGLHVLANQTDDHGTLERTYATTTADTAPATSRNASGNASVTGACPTRDCRQVIHITITFS